MPEAPRGVAYSEGTLSVTDWQKAVVEAVRRIDDGELDKVVLARDVVVTTDGPVDPRHLLTRLAATYPSCWAFSVDGLLGATPEMLVRRIGDTVTSRVLAGTMRRSSDATNDASLASALLDSAKDHAEHEYAVNSVALALAAHCTDLDVPETPRLLRLANVQHLATDVRGVLADGAPVLALAASLHPTAAVCGTPTERAFAVIRELEGMDRGRYAGPVGWVDARGDGEFGIALRCGRLEAEDRLRLFAGCGLVVGLRPRGRARRVPGQARRHARRPRTRLIPLPSPRPILRAHRPRRRCGRLVAPVSHGCRPVSFWQPVSRERAPGAAQHGRRRRRVPRRRAPRLRARHGAARALDGRQVARGCAASRPATRARTSRW